MLPEQIKQAIESKLQQEQEALTYQFRLDKEKSKAERKRIAAEGESMERCKLFALADSLGGVESLINHPAIMTHASVPSENRARLGIHDNLMRLSVGVEDVADLRAELDAALNG